MKITPNNNSVSFLAKLELAKFRHSSKLTILSKAKSSIAKLRIRCAKHGVFRQSTRQFLSVETPCPKCRAEARRVTTEDFISRAKRKHKNRFDYTSTIYVDGKTKVKIHCNKHGSFETLPHLHLRGKGGCVGCKTGKLSQEEFILKSKNIFPNRYNYSETIYSDTTKNVLIRCKKVGHGSFTQNAGNHLSGREGCSFCARSVTGRNPLITSSTRSSNRKSELISKRLSQEEFEKRVWKKHKNRYDLSQAVYKTQYDNVNIICKKHGLFTILPYNFWRGGNCPDCSKELTGKDHRIDPKLFLKKARETHKLRYDLSQVNYIKSTIKIKPICEQHGPFEVLPYNFLKGTGCPECASKRRVAAIVEATKKRDIVKVFIDVHGDRYDYSKVKYYGISIPVKIICKIHGIFEQKPITHLAKKGCPKCGNIARSAAQTLSREEVIERFISVHGDRFDYSKFDYKDGKTKSTIICKEEGHGPFQMNAFSHLEEKACPTCADPKGERKVEKWLKEKNIEYSRQFSILPKGRKDERYRLRYDFLLPERNILIEFDGEQHFRAVKFYGMSVDKANKIFELTKKRDVIKNRWAKKNGYQLLRIRYDESVIDKLESNILNIID